MDTREPLVPPEPQISIVVPAYNEAANVQPLIARLIAALSTQPAEFEIIVVDDGSRDETAARVLAAQAAQPQVRLVRLARNFGHQAALFAGMEASRGEAVITMDADLQHPPELIGALLEHWRQGADVVQTIRRDSASAGLFKSATSRGFYRLLSAISRIQVTPGAADFRLLSREAVAAFLACRERRRFNRGLVQWIGFPYVEIPYDAAPRHAGRTKYSLRAMLRLAGDAIFSFSTLPLRIAGLVGGLVSLLASIYLIYVLWARFFTTLALPGWSSIQATVLILGGMQLVVLWILGEYVGRLYEEAKQRPIYITRQTRAEPRRSRDSRLEIAAKKRQTDAVDTTA